VTETRKDFADHRRFLAYCYVDLLDLVVIGVDKCRNVMTIVVAG